MKLKIAKELSGLPTMAIGELNKLQGSLKILTDEKRASLKKSMEDNGFFIPLVLWKDKSGKWWVIDGHQRIEVIADATDNPDLQLPYIAVKAANRREAAEKLLVVSSQYGRITADGWREFSDSFKIDGDWFAETAALPFQFDWGKAAKVGPDFTPNYNPTIDNPSVTDEDIKDASPQSYDNPANYRDVCCPACAHEFQINKL